MSRLLFLLLLVLGVPFAGRTQQPDSVRRDTTALRQPVVDSLAMETTESRRERRQRERREREAADAEPVVFKDSARLALEKMSERPWKRSLMVPGWGQVTNGGWWWLKVPVIYGGFVSLALVFDFNNSYYHDILREVQYRINNNHAVPPNTKYPWLPAGQQATDRMILAKDSYRRNRDLTVLVAVGWWGLQAVEAYVTSMLKHRWEMGDELSIRVAPTIFAQPGLVSAHTYNPYTYGVKIHLQF